MSTLTANDQYQVHQLDNSFDKNDLIGNFIFDASSGQKMLWFLKKLDSKFGAAYNVSAAIKTEQAIDRLNLQRALNIIVARHEALRTRIMQLGTKLVQVIKPELPVSVSFIDFSHLAPAQSWAEATQFMSSESRAVFNFSESNLFKITLLKIDVNINIIFLVSHHIVLDGISIEIILKELINVYRDLNSGLKSNLQQPKLQFADFVAWQQQWIKSDDYATHLNYWLKQLSGTSFQLNLPYDKEPEQNQNLKGATKKLSFSAELVNNIRNIAKQHETTVYMILLTSFAVLLNKYSGQNDFLIGTPIANRQKSEFEQIVGFLVNTLVIRAELKQESSFKEVLSGLHKTVMQAITHQQVPFANLVEELKPQRSAEHNPIFQVMFGLQELHNSSLANSYSYNQFSQVPIDYGLSKFNLSIFLIEDAVSLHGYVEYNSSLFSDQMIEKLITHYKSIINSLNTNILQNISNINFNDIPKHAVACPEINHNSAPNSMTQPSPTHRTNTVIKLETLWLKILGHTSFDNNSDFFQVGGNSLLVGQLATEIDKLFNAKLSMRSIFQNNTVNKLASAIDQAIELQSKVESKDIVETIIEQLEDTEIDLLLNDQTINI